MTDSISLKTPDWSGNPFIQANRLGQCWMNVQGIYSGSPDYVEMQITTFDGSNVGPGKTSGGTVIVPWQALAGGGSGTIGDGLFNGPVGFGGGGGQALQITVRFHNEPSVCYASNAFGWGDIIVLTGQSLAEIFIGSKTSPPLAATCFQPVYVPNAAEAAGLSFGSFEGWSLPGLGNGATTLANALFAVTGRAVGFIFLGRGGTSMVQDDAGSAPLTYLTSMDGEIANAYTQAMMTKGLIGLRQAAAIAFGPPDFAMVLHIHGEADGSSELDPKLYYDALTRYYAGLRGITRRSPKECPFYLPIVGKYGSSDMSGIREAMLQWAQATPGAVVCADRYDAYPLADEVHWDSAHQVQGANRLAMDILTHMGHSTVKGAGPRVVKATRSGTTITLTVDLNTHSGIAAQNGGSPLTGFLVSASRSMSSPISLTNAVVSGSTIVLTAASAFPAPSYVKFQPTAYVEPSTDNNVYSTDLCVGDALSMGLPLQPTPCALIAA